ncbi:SdiA-regulated domain-containing protein [Synechococcus sp. MIT S1220]|uniref:SdiA-regulated domain-containing protein n=1 Tax=Synechococcus sp. MIT S1220 TaxID=3082549 RepID=UPI0039AEAB81
MVAAHNNLTLELVDINSIGDQAAGLNEPSGLTLDAEGRSLFTVSDDTKAIFRIDLKGKLLITDCFFVEVSDLEGIACSPDGSELLVVEEGTNAIICIDPKRRLSLRHCPLSGMKNYKEIKKYFSDGITNKGLEGITIDPLSLKVYVVKEGQPGLIIEVSADLKTILDARVLDQSNGFEHPKLTEKKLDYSGLSFDCSRNLIWIASDKGECIYLYDWIQNRVVQRIDLQRSLQSKKKLIRKIEGVAVDWKGEYLYAVSERDCTLYSYKIT